MTIEEVPVVHGRPALDGRLMTLGEGGLEALASEAAQWLAGAVSTAEVLRRAQREAEEVRQFGTWAESPGIV